jgi:Zn ribbon nucleic-acid-binding protein
MTILNVLRRRRFVAAAVLSGCAGVVALSMWQAGGIPATNAAGALSEKQMFQERIRRGVGSEVRFSTAKDSDAAIKASIESVAVFIHSRSGMTMSDETKSDLVRAEAETLGGKRPRISIEALTDSLAASAAESVATLNDKEIDRALNTFRSTSDSQIILRMAGQVGQVSRENLLQGAASAIDLKRSGELESSIRPFFEAQVTDRANNLSTAMPEQFGSIRTDGVTPAQAVLIAYSVASDDSLADSRTDFARQITEERMNRRLTRAEAKSQRLNSPTPYGRNGFFYAAPVNILFNRRTVNSLLTTGEGGESK